MTGATSSLARLGLIVTAVMLATIALGWFGPLFVAVVLAALDRRPSVPREAGVGAAVAWLLIIGFTVFVGGTQPVGQLGAALQMPAFVLPLVSVLFAAGLAWSAGTLVAMIRHAVRGRPFTTG
jgi:hypothetical protein